jgi:hypothetical protein
VYLVVGYNGVWVIGTQSIGMCVESIPPCSFPFGCEVKYTTRLLEISHVGCRLPFFFFFLLLVFSALSMHLQWRDVNRLLLDWPTKKGDNPSKIV